MMHMFCVEETFDDLIRMPCPNGVSVWEVCQLYESNWERMMAWAEEDQRHKGGNGFPSDT